MVLRAWKALLLFLLVACAATGAKAQTDFVVVDIEVQGNRIATSSLILGVSSIARGSPLTAANVQSSIHRLYDLGIFSDVQIKAEEVTGGLKVLIVVTELPKLTGIEFSGNKKIKDKDLKEKIGLGVGGYISPYLIHEANEKIVKAYAEKGYFQASAEHSLTLNADTTEAILSFKITERSKVKVKEVVLTGTKRVEPNDLVKKMRNRPHGFLKSSDFAQEKYPEDKEKIIAEYRKKGYLDAQLLSDSMYIDTAINRMTIYLDVYEGPLYYFGDAAFEGNEKFDSEFLGSLLKFEKDKVFNIEKYDESVYELYTAY